MTNKTGSATDRYFNAIEDTLRPLAFELRSIIVGALPHARESIKWNFPVYEENGLICSIRVSSKHVALQFFQSGTMLDDPNRLLEGSGKKMRHIKIRKKTDINVKLLESWLKQAARINQPNNQ